MDSSRTLDILIIVMVVLTSFSFGLAIGDFIHQANQSAVCAVLSKHTQNRDPEMVNGECTMLVGVGDVRVRMTVTEYGGMILEDEQ